MRIKTLLMNSLASATLSLVWAASAGAVTTLPPDSGTKGDWMGTYGSCAYVLAAGQAEVRCQMPIRDPRFADPACDSQTCPDGLGDSLTCPFNSGSPPGPGNANAFRNYVGGATNSLMDCAKTSVGQSGASIKYQVRRCTALPDAAGASAQGWVWNSRVVNTWDPGGCMTTDPSAPQQPTACLPPELGGTKPLGQYCTNIFAGGRVAATWDDAMEIAGVGSGGAELCVDVDFSQVPDRANAPYKLSTYMLDYDQLNRQQNVSLYQCAGGTSGPNCEDTGTLVAGPTLISNFSQGTYLSWQFGPGMALPDRLTIRTSRVNSLNAVLSGLFLDRTDSSTCTVKPAVTLKKYTNGWAGDVANGLPKTGPGPGVPDPTQSNFVAEVAPGAALSWTYVVTNTGSEALNSVSVTDNRGVAVTCPATSLAVGASMTCTATGTAADLTNLPEAMGCGNGTNATRKTYVNVGTVNARGAVSSTSVSAQDPSAYCNPPTVKIVKFTNGHDGDNANGVPDPNPGSFTIGSGTVAQVAPGGAITWTYRVTNTGPAPLSNVVVTDDRGVSVTCPKTTLAPGETISCTAMGVAAPLTDGAPNVQGCGSGGTSTRPTYVNKGKVTANDTITGTVVQDSNPSHYCNPPPPPPCNLELNKYCEIVQPPSTDWASCKGKLQQFSLVWPATAGTVNISGIVNNAPGGVVNPGQRVTFTGPFAVNDLFLNVSGAVTGQSTFHVSCSDADMDGRTSTNLSQQQLPGKAQDCGKFQGDGKAKSGIWINTWLLDGLVDAEGKVLNCSTTPTPPTSSCSFEAQDPPQCGTGGTYKPTTLTFRYTNTGNRCTTQSNTQAAGKVTCTPTGPSNTFDATKPATITAVPGGTFTVNPGDTFTIPRTATNSVFTLRNAGGASETITIHTSCSQPLVVGDIYYDLTLVAEDGIGAGQQVKYTYAVRNKGTSTIGGIVVDDDKLGFITDSPITLAQGQTATLSASAFIDKTTTNVAEAYNDLTCAKGAVTASATVTVTAPPPCSVSQDLDQIADDKIVYKITNAGNKVVTYDTLTLNFPTARGAIKEVKREGDKIYESSKSSLVVTSGVTITSTAWTNSDVAKRQIKPGETKKLEIVFTTKSKATASAFSGTATFAEGCSADLAP